MYYVSGIISAVFIPIMFFYFSVPTYNKLNLRVLDIGLPYKLKKGEKDSEYSYSTIPSKDWNYKSVNVNKDFNKKSEDYFLKLLNNLKENNIDKTGIKFQFSDQNTYADLVRLLNILQKTKQEMYGLDMEKTNSLYVLHVKPNLKEENYLSSDTISESYLNQNEYDYKYSNFLEKFIQYSPRESYYLLCGYLLLVYCTILKPKLKFEI